MAQRIFCSKVFAEEDIDERMNADEQQVNNDDKIIDIIIQWRNSAEK